jgi:hypothetical protein
MRNAFFLLLLLILPFTLADSNAFGLLAGTTEDIKVFYYNSTYPAAITTGTCGVLIFYPNNTFCKAATLAHYNNGLYNYSWAVPTLPLGLYSFQANCTNSGNDNQSFSGSAYVVSSLAIASAITVNISDNSTNTTTIYNNTYNFTEIYNYTTNYTVNITNGTTIITNTTLNYTVDISSLNTRIDRGFEDIKRLLREILEFLKKHLTFWTLVNPF